MKIVQHLCLLVLCYAVGHGHSSLDGGRNDGEPDYDPGVTEFELRNGGQNDDEPDYVPEFLELRDGGRNNGEPDYDPGFSFNLRDGGRNDGEPDYDPGYFFELRDGSQNDRDNDVLEVPDSVWQNEANQSGTSPTL